MESLLKTGAEMEDANELDDTLLSVLPSRSLSADAEDCSLDVECNCVSDSA